MNKCAAHSSNNVCVFFKLMLHSSEFCFNGISSQMCYKAVCVICS